MSDESPLEERLSRIFDARDRADMQPTIDAMLEVLAEHPDDPLVLYEVGGAYDTAGREELAVGYYERAMDRGLAGEHLRRCYLQYGSTLRNLGRSGDALQVFRTAREAYPESESLVVFEALALASAGRATVAVAGLLELIADRLRTPEIVRYERAIRGYAEELALED